MWKLIDSYDQPGVDFMLNGVKNKRKIDLPTVQIL